MAVGSCVTNLYRSVFFIFYTYTLNYLQKGKLKRWYYYINYKKLILLLYLAATNKSIV